jgi:hypothetical protein
MMHRQQIVQPGPRSNGAQGDAPRPFVPVQSHEDVVHRVQRLRVKDGALQILSCRQSPALFPAK